jgi:hypothetical protein
MAEGNAEGTETGNATGNQGTEKPAWLAQLPADLKDNETFTGYKTIGDLAKAHLDTSAKVKDLEGIKSKFDSLPKAPADPKEYQFDKVEGVDESILEGARPEFLKAGLTNDQAKAMVALESALMAKRVEAFAAQSENDRQAAETALKAEWGAKYPERVENISRFMKAIGKDIKVDGKPVDVDAYLVTKGLGNDPFFIRMVDAIAQKLPEDTSPSGRSPSNEGNKGMISLYKQTA